MNTDREWWVVVYDGKDTRLPFPDRASAMRHLRETPYRGFLLVKHKPKENVSCLKKS